MQANLAAWERTARQDENLEWSEETGILTVQPKGILVIGHTRQLKTRTQKATLERFRRNLWNPEVITYDELRDRAKFLVQRADEDASGITVVAAGPPDLGDGWEPDDGSPGDGDPLEPPDDSLDDLPF